MRPNLISFIEVIDACDRTHQSQLNQDHLLGHPSRVKFLNIGLQNVIQLGANAYEVVSSKNCEDFLKEVKLPAAALIASHIIGIPWQKKMNHTDSDSTKTKLKYPFIWINSMCLISLCALAFKKSIKKRSVIEGVRALIMLYSCLGKSGVIPPMNKITTKIQSKKIAHFMILWAALRSLINANNYRRLMKKYHGRYKFIAAIGFGYQTVKITYEMFLKLRYYFVKLEQAKHVKKFTSADLDPNLCKLALGDTDPGTKFRFTTEFSKVGVAYDLEIAAKHKEKASSALDKIETFLRGKNMLGKRPCTLGSTYSVSLLRAKENILRDDCRGIWGPLSKKLDKLLVEMEKSDEFTGIFESRFIPNYCGCFETLHATEPDLRTVEASTIVDSFINHCHMAKEDALKFISSMDLKDVKAFKQLRKNGSRIKDQEHFKQLKTENLQQAEQVEKSVGKRETFLSRESKNAHLKLKLERIYADLFYLDHDVAYLNDEIKFNQDLMTKANYTPELVRFYFDKIFINKVDAIVERFVDKIIENPESQLLGSLKDELKKIEHKFQERDSESETESSKPEEWFSNSYLERSIDEGAPNQELTDLFDGSNVTSRIRAYVQRISDNNLDKEDVTQALMCLLQAQGIIESPNS